MAVIKDVLSMRFLPEGPQASFFAFFSDFVCGIPLVIGLGTRWALYCFGNILMAWALVHLVAFAGKALAVFVES